VSNEEVARAIDQHCVAAAIQVAFGSYRWLIDCLRGIHLPGHIRANASDNFKTSHLPQKQVHEGEHPISE
jgi:hypothetical protein